MFIVEVGILIIRNYRSLQLIKKLQNFIIYSDAYSDGCFFVFNKFEQMRIDNFATQFSRLGRRIYDDGLRLVSQSNVLNKLKFRSKVGARQLSKSGHFFLT